MAAVMTVTATPLNVLAQPAGIAPTNLSVGTGVVARSRLSRSPVSAPEGALFVEAGAREGTAVSGSIRNSDFVEDWVEGSNLIIQFEETITNTGRPVEFVVELDNASWFFRNQGNPDLGNFDSASFNTANGSWNADTRTYTRTTSNPGELNYQLQVSSANPSRATVRLTPAQTQEVSMFKKEKPTQAPEATTQAAPTIAKPAKPSTETGAVQVDAMSPLDDYARDITRNNGNGNGNGNGYTSGALARNSISSARTRTDEARAAVSNSNAGAVEAGINQAKAAISQAIEAMPELSAVTRTAGQEADRNAARDAIASAKNYLDDAATALYDLDLDDTDPIPAAPNAERTNLVNALDNAYAQLGTAYDRLNTYVGTENGTSNGTTAPGNGNGNGNGNNGATVTEGDLIIIPLVARGRGDGGEASVRVIESNLIPIQNHTLVFGRITGGAATSTSVSSPATGRDHLVLGPIGIFENRIGALPENGNFELLAPSGFHFVNTNRVRLTAESGVSGNIMGHNDPRPVQIVNDARTLQIRYRGLNRSTTITGQLALEGIELMASSPDTVREGDIYMTIRNIADTGSTVSQQTFLVGTVSDWRINMTTTNAVPTLVNGSLVGIEEDAASNAVHRAARIRIEERIPEAWWGQRTTTLTLPQGVKIREARFMNVRNISNSEELTGGETTARFFNTRGRTNTGNVRINDNTLSITGLSIIPGQRASFEIELWLTIESGFEGDIDVRLSGSALASGTEATQTVTIAEAINPVEVTTNVTNVRLGHQFAPIGNFTIKESRAGVLGEGEEVFITVTDNIFSELHIAGGFNAAVTSGDLQIRNLRTANNISFLGLSQTARTGANISFEIDRESTEASTIEFSNVQVRLANNVPQVNTSYDLVVWGPAIAQNYEGLRPTDNENVNRSDFFSTPGIRTPLVNAQGGGIGTGVSMLTNVVRVTVDNPIMMVNNEQMAMDVFPYISPNSDSLMIPVRFVAMALGLDASRVIWSPQTSTATIDAGERIVQFRTNSNIMLINGIEFPMLNAAGQPVHSEVRDGRSFIPFRALAEALNVHVEWDAVTATATFDPSRAPATNFALDGLGSIAHYGQIRDRYTPLARLGANSRYNVTNRAS